LQALRKEQEAILAEAKASLRLAEATFERTARLETSGAVSTQDLDRVTQARDTAAASVARVEAALERIGVDLSKSRLMAPYDGHIAVRRVDEGAMVQPGSSVLEIIESGVLEARIGLPQAVVADIEVGEPALLQRAASGEPLSAEIARLSPRHDERRRTVDVLLAIRQEVALLDGELVEWPMTREIAGRGAWLPRSALTASVRGLWAVYVTLPLNDSRQRELERREVELIHIAGDRVFVRGTLRESEGVGPEGIEVVAEGLQRLVPGQRVEVVSGDASSRETVVTR
jgi:RND family efflux transporter MFP subunit